MQLSDRTKSYCAAAIFAIAGFLGFRFFKAGPGVSEAAFFYDLSEGKLFKADRTAIPPIRGVNDAQEDAVRAVVISTNGNPGDKASWTIAYLEKYSPELKSQMETARATGGSPAMGRGAAQAHRFVRRVDNPEWFPMNSPEGEQIASEWASPGPNGITPVVCAP